MLSLSNLKLAAALIATIMGAAGYYPYFRDIFKGKTKPHMYTWLIWALTQGTIAAGLWYGGGGYAAISVIGGTILIIAIFFLTFKYGTKNIRFVDTISLIAALIAIIVWWQLHNPLLAVLIVTLIDTIGYFPTFRKSYVEPRSETLTFWFVIVLSTALTIFSLNEYTFLTATYLVTMVITNSIVWTICFVRRKSIN